MARIEPLGHWDFLFEGMQAASREYYDSVERAVDARAIPNVMIHRTLWKESGFLSGNREYLRVRRGQFVMDICGAPFGKGFFFSWWLGLIQPSPIGPTIIMTILLFALLLLTNIFALIILPILYLFIGWVIIGREMRLAPYLLAIPLLGLSWRILFLPETYYRTDTRIMYQTAVHAAVMEVIDSMTKTQNLERITDDARKPIMRDLFKR